MACFASACPGARVTCFRNSEYSVRRKERGFRRGVGFDSPNPSWAWPNTYKLSADYQSPCKLTCHDLQSDKAHTSRNLPGRKSFLHPGPFVVGWARGPAGQSRPRSKAFNLPRRLQRQDRTVLRFWIFWIGEITAFCVPKKKAPTEIGRRNISFLDRKNNFLIRKEKTEKKVALQET